MIFNPPLGTRKFNFDRRHFRHGGRGAEERSRDLTQMSSLDTHSDIETRKDARGRFKCLLAYSPKNV